MGLVTTGVEYVGIMDAIKAAGYSTQTFTGVGGYEAAIEALHSAGWSEIINEFGTTIGWAKGTTITEVATSTATTGSTSSVMLSPTIQAALEAGELTVSDAGLGAGVAGGEAAATGIVFTPKTAVICAAAAAMGLTFGFDLGQDLVDKLFFDDKYFDWSKDSVGGKVIGWLSDDGKTVYYSEDLLNNIKEHLLEIGAFGSGYVPSDLSTQKDISDILDNLVSYDELKNYIDYSEYDEDDVDKKWGSQTLNKAREQAQSTGGLEFYHLVKEYNLTAGFFPSYTQATYVSVTGAGKVGFSNGFLNYSCNSDESLTLSISLEYTQNIKSPAQVNTTTSGRSASNIITLTGTGGYQMFRSQGNYWSNYGKIEGIEGVSKRTGATIPKVGVPLSTTYPDWANANKTISRNIGDNASVFPLNTNDQNPKDYTNNHNQDDAQSGEQTDSDTDEKVKTQDDVAEDTDTSTNVTPNVDIGVITPSALLPGTSDTGMIAIYNPTQNQLANFSQWLWSDNFIEYIKKLLNDPMQAVIGLHMLYANPTSAGTSNIVVGRVDSGVSCNVVKQYIDINCGSIKVNKYFNNALDYTNTRIEIYLPFIGIVQLNTSDVMNKTINVRYKVDVLTGTCLASIYSESQLLYEYGGNCSVQLPITGSNYSSIMGALTTIAGGVAGYAVGGPVGAVTGALGGASKGFSQTTQISGNLGSNAGAMGQKIPYLIISRNRPYQPNNYNTLYGYPANSTVTLANCTGYTRVKDVHVNIVATDTELEMIENQLKEGVIL
jgi:hypothetical protein